MTATTPKSSYEENRINPDIPEDSFGIEELGRQGRTCRSNIHFRDKSYMWVMCNDAYTKFFLKCPSKSVRYWVKIEDLDRFLNQGWIPPKPLNPSTPKKSRAVIREVASKTKDTSVRTITNNTLIRMVGYLLKWFQAPVFRPITVSQATTGSLDLHALTMTIISARSLGQFLAEANGYMPNTAVKLPPEFDTSYLDLEKDDPNKPEDTITEIKLRAWYTEMRAKCKAELSSLQFKYGTISKNSYAFFLERCFSKEFGKTEVSKKTLQVSAKAESKDKEKTEKDKVDHPSLCDVQICFDEDVAKEG